MEKDDGLDNQLIIILCMNLHVVVVALTVKIYPMDHCYVADLKLRLRLMKYLISPLDDFDVVVLSLAQEP